MSKCIDVLVNNFFLYFPTENVQGIEFNYNENFNPFELLIKYPDGTIKVYDDIDKSIRIICHSREDISEDIYEDIWKREFARRIKWRMQRKGYTQEELAAEVGTSQTMINRYLTGKTIPSFYMVTRLATVLDCTPNDLYIK